MTHNVLILKWSFIQPGEQGKQKMLQWISIENRYNNFKASMQISPDLSSVSKARIITISLTLQQFRYKMGTLNAEARCRCGALVSAVAGGGGVTLRPHWLIYNLRQSTIYWATFYSRIHRLQHTRTRNIHTLSPSMANPGIEVPGPRGWDVENDNWRSTDKLKPFCTG